MNELKKKDEGKNLSGGIDGRHFPLKRIRDICLSEGADDVGFVEAERESLSTERNDILRVYKKAKTLIAIVKSVNRESIYSPSASVADYEFCSIHKELLAITDRIIRRLNREGIKGVTIPPGFPMDMDRWPGKIWEVSHKIVAEEAGIGKMGINRIIIHPLLGSHIILDTILIDAALDEYSKPLTENPCIKCHLCVSVCPVGAIGKDGEFDFMACAMHNYHDLFGGFQEWIEDIARSGDIKTYRKKFKDSETLTKWQSLTYGHFYRCSYCIAVCPGGKKSGIIYNKDRKDYFSEIVKPLKDKKEPVYVIKGTRAERHARHNNNKEIRYVRNTIRPNSIKSFLDGVPLLFNPLKAKDIDMVVHFQFTGDEEIEATIKISDSTVIVQQGLTGQANLKVKVDSGTWIGILNEEVSPLKAILGRKMRIKGNPLYLQKFKRCIL